MMKFLLSICVLHVAFSQTNFPSTFSCNEGETCLLTFNYAGKSFQFDMMLDEEGFFQEDATIIQGDTESLLHLQNQGFVK
jgi:hypothetical protein